MKNTLLLTVGSGTGDKQASLAESICSSILQHGVDAFILISSEDEDSQLIADMILDRFEEHPIKGHIAANCFPDPFNLQSCRDLLENAILSAQTDGHENLKLNLTSGTKQMAIGGMMAALSQQVEIVTFIGGQFEQGTIIEGTESIIPVEMRTFFKQQAIKDSKRLAENGALWGAVEILIPYNSLISIKNKYQTLSHWQDLDFPSARQLASSLPKLRKLNQYFAECFQTPLPNKISIADMMASGERLLEWKSYNDALVRIYQSLESAARDRLQKMAGLKLKGSSYELDAVLAIPGMSQKLSKKFRTQSFENNQVVLGQFALFECLDALGESSGKAYHADRELIEILRKRNEFIHTGIPPEPSLVHQIKNRVFDFMHNHYPEIQWQRSKKMWIHSLEAG